MTAAVGQPVRCDSRLAQPEMPKDVKFTCQDCGIQGYVGTGDISKCAFKPRIHATTCCNCAHDNHSWNQYPQKGCHHCKERSGWSPDTGADEVLSFFGVRPQPCLDGGAHEFEAVSSKNHTTQQSQAHGSSGQVLVFGCGGGGSSHTENSRAHDRGERIVLFCKKCGFTKTR